MHAQNDGSIIQKQAAYLSTIQQKTRYFDISLNGISMLYC